MSEVFGVPEATSSIKKRESESYGEAIDGDEVVTVDHFTDSIGNTGQL